MARSQKFFDIEIMNWEQYNPTNKKCSWFRLESSLVRSHKWLQLSPGGKLLWLYLLSEASVRGPVGVRVLPAYVSHQCHIKPQSIPGVLDQLVTNEWIRILAQSDTLCARSPTDGTVRTKRTVRTDDSVDPGKIPGNPPVVVVPDLSETEKRNLNRELWDTFTKFYRLRYKEDPLRDAAANSIMGKFRNKVGVEQGKKIIEFFIRHQDAFYVKNAHAVWIMNRDADGLRMQCLKNKMITNADVRRYERSQEQMGLLNDIEGKDL